jgi:hypothetical protein
VLAGAGQGASNQFDMIPKKRKFKEYIQVVWNEFFIFFCLVQVVISAHLVRI